MDNNNLNNQTPNPLTPPPVPDADPVPEPTAPQDGQVIDPTVDGPLNFVTDPNAGKITGSAASLLGDIPAPAAPEAPAQNPQANNDNPAPNPETAPESASEPNPGQTPTPEPTAPPAPNPAADALAAAAAAEPGFDMKSGAFGPGQPKKKAPLAPLLAVVVLLAVVGIVCFLLFTK